MASVRHDFKKAGLFLIVSPAAETQGLKSCSGTVLRRRAVGEGDLLLTLFLKGAGLTYVSARGAASGSVRFGGGTEPLIWGKFSLYAGRGGKCHLKGVDIADDLLKLRGRGDALFVAVRWAGLIVRYVPYGHPLDDLLANLYWNLKLLDSRDFPAEAADWRFMWRWLKSQGLAPDIFHGDGCGHEDAFSPEQLILLRSVAEMPVSKLPAFIAERNLTSADLRLLSDAARRMEIFLNEA